MQQQFALTMRQMEQEFEFRMGMERLKGQQQVEIAADKAEQNKSVDTSD